MRFVSHFSQSQTISRCSHLKRWIQNHCNLQNPRLLIGSHARATVGIRVSEELGSSPRLKYMICTPFVNVDSISLTVKVHKLSLTQGNMRSIMTWSSVDKQETIKALENFLSIIEDTAVSTKDRCSTFIEKLVRLGNLPPALYLLSYLHKRQIHLGLNIYNILLNAAAGDANNFPIFAEIFRQLLLFGLSPDFTSYVNVAKAFQNVSDSNTLLSFIREISEITINREPIVVNRIIFIIAKSGQLDTSLLIFEDLKNSDAKMDTVTFNTVLVMLGRAGRVDQMLYELNAMKDLGLAPNIITYNTLINCLRRLGRLDMCKTFAKEMVERGIKLDLRTYTALIDGFGRAGHVEDAMRLFEELKKSHRPSIYVYRAMISNLKKAGKFEQALYLLEEMNSGNLKLIGPKDFKQNKTRKYKSNVGLVGS